MLKKLLNYLCCSSEKEYTLNIIIDKISLLTKYLEKEYYEDIAIRNFCYRFNNITIVENISTDLGPAYLIDRNRIAIRIINEKEEECDINTLIFITIHLLALSVSEEKVFDQEFWYNFKFLPPLLQQFSPSRRYRREYYF